MPEKTPPPTSTFPEVWDNTIRSSWGKCPQLFFRSHVQNLRLRALSIHLEAGGTFAKALCEARRAFYEQKQDTVTAERIGLKALYETYPKVEMEAAASGDKSLDGVVKGYESYFLEYPMADSHVQPLIMPNGKAAVEFSFASPLEILHPETGNPILYAGRFDMLGIYNRSLFVVDEKTTTQLGEQWKRNWDLDSQFTGYVWGAKTFGHPVVGAIVRGIGLLKTKTTHAEVITYRPQWLIERWYGELCQDVEDAIRAWKNSRFRYALDKFQCNAYGGCPMNTLCQSPQPEKWIETHYHVVKWNPLGN